MGVLSDLLETVADGRLQPQLGVKVGLGEYLHNEVGNFQMPAAFLSLGPNRELALHDPEPIEQVLSEPFAPRPHGCQVGDALVQLIQIIRALSQLLLRKLLQDAKVAVMEL